MESLPSSRRTGAATITERMAREGRGVQRRPGRRDAPRRRRPYPRTPKPRRATSSPRPPMPPCPRRRRRRRPGGARRMSTLGPGMVPAPLAQLPWKIILLVLAIGCFGLVVLYSAAGGSLHPWALSQGVRFFVFLGMAIVLSRVPEDFWAHASLPDLRSDPGDAARRRGARRGRRRQPALARPRHHPPPAVGADETGHRPRLRALLRDAAARARSASSARSGRRGADRPARGAGDAPARSRHRADDHRRRHHSDVPRRHPAAPVHRRRAGAGGRRCRSSSISCFTIISATAC